MKEARKAGEEVEKEQRKVGSWIVLQSVERVGNKGLFIAKIWAPTQRC